MSPDTGIGVAESGQSAPREAEPTYLSGFGNEFASEAVPGALPRGPELAAARRRSASTPSSCRARAFTAPRAENRRSWLYRIRPSAMHRPFRRIDDGLIRTRALQRGRAVAEPAALGPAAVSRRARPTSSTAW